MCPKGINEKDCVGTTRLFEAVSDGNVKLVKRLLGEGADPNIAENNGTTPLMEAATDGSKVMVELLLSYGAAPDAKDKFGDTASVYARAQRHERVAVFLEDLTRLGNEKHATIKRIY